MTAKKEAATKEDSKAKQGLIHLYFGTGKGKTTASVGLATRARAVSYTHLCLPPLFGRGDKQTQMLFDLVLPDVFG